MAQIFAVMLIGLLAGCAQHEAPLERDALGATVAMATNDDEFCRNYGAKPGTQIRGLSPEPLESARGHNPNA